MLAIGARLDCRGMGAMKKTIEDINKMYFEAIAIEKQMNTKSEMEALAGDVVSSRRIRNEWYLLEDKLKEKLRAICSEDFILMTKPKLIKFLVLCCSHRPVEPVWVLTDISIQYKEIYPCEKSVKPS
jgi:hypothetical protein